MTRRRLLVGLLIGALVLPGLTGLVFRDRLRAHYYLWRARGPDADPAYWLPRMAQTGPEGVRLMLDACKGGSYDGDIEQLVGRSLRTSPGPDVYPPLAALLEDPEPRVRGFAALVAGHTEDRRYLPLLERLADDESALPEGWFETTVGQRARHAVNWIRRDTSSDDVDEQDETTEALAAEP